jgi:hypothetical protein
MAQAPNLGLVNAGGAQALQNELQKMVAERQADEQLRYERAIAEREWTEKQRQAQELRAHQKALQDYQMKDLEVRQAAANQLKPASIIQLTKRPSGDPNDPRTYTHGIREDTGEKLWASPEAPDTTGPGMQSETVMVNGQKYLGSYNPKTAKYYDQNGQVIPNAQPVPKEVDPLLEAIRGQTIALNRQVLNQDLPPNVQKRVDHYGDQFQGDSVVKRFNVVATANRFLQAMPDDTKNPADHQAFIYTFAKASDPDSAVRGEEYDIIAKYAQSWLDKFGFDLKRVLSGAEILTPQAIQNIKANVATKLAAERQGYNQIRNEFGQQINLATGKADGTDRLVQFDVGAGRGPGSVAGGGGGGGKIKIADPTGKIHEFDTQAAADRAKAGWDAYLKSRGGGR